MRKLIGLLAILALAGCVTLTETERDEREYNRVERSEVALAAMIDCESRGGLVVISRGSGSGLRRNSRELGSFDSWRCK
jgi:hypothetical protein